MIVENSSTPPRSVWFDSTDSDGRGTYAVDLTSTDLVAGLGPLANGLCGTLTGIIPLLSLHFSVSRFLR